MTSQGGSGGAPLGPAGGVLGGNYPSPTFSTAGTTPIFGVLLNSLGADVPMANANQFYDGPSLSLIAGTWLLWGVVTLSSTTGAVFMTPKLWDGVTALQAPETVNTGISEPIAVPLFGVATPVVTTTYKISAASGSVNGIIRAASGHNGAGNIASQLLAFRIA